MKQPPWTHLPARLLAFTLAMLLALAPAAGQENSGPPAIGLSLAGELQTVDFRAGSVAVPAERGLPLVVELGPGDFSGAVLVEFVQDITQSARIVIPAAATPNAITRVPVVAALPAGVPWIKVSLAGQTSAGKAVTATATWRLDSLGDDRMPFVVSGDSQLLYVAGQVRPEVLQSAEARGPDDWSRGRFANETFPATLRFNAIDLPTSAMGYDAAMALVLRVSDLSVRGGAEARVRAVLDWVASGGRLVLVADAPGAAWRQWLPPGPTGELIVLDQPRQVDTPGDLRQLASGAAPTTFSARPVTLTPRGEAEGWTLDWQNASGEALIAQGPVGLGWVVVVGTEPAVAIPGLSADARSAIWADVLTKPLEWDTPHSRSSALSNRSPGVMVNLPEDAAVGEALDSLAEVPAIGGGVFWMIAIAMVALALLLGPGDSLVLMRLQLRHRSWLTALTWIGLASLAAYLTPLLLRTGPSRVGTLAHVDVLARADGEVSSWRTSYLGIFAASQTSTILADPAPRSWWRGVSTLNRGVGDRTALSTFQTVQVAGANLPMGKDEQGGVRLSLWTFRAFLERAVPGNDPTGTGAFKASVERKGDVWQIRLAGLPEGFQPELVTLFAGENQVQAHSTEMRGSELFAEVAAEQRSAPTESGARSALDVQGRHRGMANRSDVMAARLATGRFALLRVQAKVARGPVDLTVSAEESHTLVLRVLVELSPDDALTPAPAN